MARPRTEIGTYGAIKLVGQVRVEGRWITAPPGSKPARFRARAKYRDVDGKLRDVERFASTKTRAEADLKRALKDRRAPAQGGDMRADMTVAAAAEVWLSRVTRTDRGLAASTHRQYRRAVRADVLGSTIAELTLREANRVGVIEGWLQLIADRQGSGSAKTARTVLSSILGEAVRLHVLDHNSAHEVRPAKSQTVKLTERNTERAFTREQRDHMLAFVETAPLAQRHDLVDLFHLLAGIGCRIGEGLAVLWTDVNLAANSIHVRGTKSDAADRLVTMPPWLHERMRERAERIGTEGLVFPSPSLSVPELAKGRGGHASDRTRVRDTSNVCNKMRALFDEAGYEWATSHVFRRTVASLIVEAGLPINHASDMLGHADVSMTQRHYVGRNRTDTSAAAKVL